MHIEISTSQDQYNIGFAVGVNKDFKRKSRCFSINIFFIKTLLHIGFNYGKI